MPLYEYKCEKCPRTFEKLRKISERETAPCPVCSSDSPKAVSAPRGVHGGFFDTVTKVR